MKFIRPKNWMEFQHYKDRNPAWIKLHRHLLDDFEFHLLPTASKALAPLLWLLASEHENGDIPSNTRKIAFRLRMTLEDLSIAFEPLLRAGFFEVIGNEEEIDSSTLAQCEQPAIPERETQVTSKTQTKTEAETEGDAREARPPKRAGRVSLPDGFPAHSERQWAEEFWIDRKRPDLVAVFGDIADQFADYHARHGTRAADWPATWRTWARKAIEFNKPPEKQRISAHDKGTAGFAAWLADREDHGLGADDRTGTSGHALSANGHDAGKMEIIGPRLLGGLPSPDAGTPSPTVPRVPAKA